ncbi:MAG TPA: O-acetyl-ADP-ribose deacetylase [Methylomirabilota bacterium]|nr:O-acetyl-ADP-ribose deacetylase [Methylomirabilota bacterium]
MNVLELVARMGDITTLSVDAIVNAANGTLAPGGGVCGAIHAKAGPELAAACAALGGCPSGEARITPGFRLPARHVIHAVGPIWRGGTAREPELLASAYRSAIHLAQEHELRSVAFPAISTGAFGYPLRPATKIAVEAVRAATAKPGTLRQVIFACFSSDVFMAYRDEGIAGQA